MSFLIVLAMIFAVYIALVLCLWHRERTGETHFDERQEQARGKAYQYGFFALAVSVWFFPRLAEAFPWIGVEAGNMLCVDLGMTVFAVTAVWKDAYLEPHKRTERTAASLALAGAGCLCLSVFRLWREGLLVDGTLNLWAVVTAVSVSDLLVLTVFWYRYISGRREEEAE